MTNRTPTTREQSEAFYRRAIAGTPQEVHEGEPHVGFWKIRLVRRGPWVPVRIWLEQDIDEAGELIAPEVLRCTVDGVGHDPLAVWVHASQRPIPDHEFRYLTALRAWQRINEPELWDPMKPVDMTETPIET